MLYFVDLLYEVHTPKSLIMQYNKEHYKIFILIFMSILAVHHGLYNIYISLEQSKVKKVRN